MSKKVKKSSSNILDKVRVLDEFKLPENQRKTVKEKAALASHILGRTMNASTIFPIFSLKNQKNKYKLRIFVFF